jgi:hypothetical protein
MLLQGQNEKWAGGTIQHLCIMKNVSMQGLIENLHETVQLFNPNGVVSQSLGVLATIGSRSMNRNQLQQSCVPGVFHDFSAKH